MATALSHRADPEPYDPGGTVTTVADDMTAIFGTGVRTALVGPVPAASAGSRTARRGALVVLSALGMLAVIGGGVLAGRSAVGGATVAAAPAKRAGPTGASHVVLAPIASVSAPAAVGSAPAAALLSASAAESTVPTSRPLAASPAPAGSNTQPPDVDRIASGGTAAETPAPGTERVADAPRPIPVAPADVSAPPPPRAASVAAPQLLPSAREDRVAAAPFPPDRFECEGSAQVCRAARFDEADRRLASAFRSAEDAGVEPKTLRGYRDVWERARRESVVHPRNALQLYGMVTSDLYNLADDASARAGDTDR